MNKKKTLSFVKQHGRADMKPFITTRLRDTVTMTAAETRNSLKSRNVIRNIAASSDGTESSHKDLLFTLSPL